MWVKASHKYQTQFAFVRKTNAYLTSSQQVKFQQALQVENQLYNFALSYLYKTYGRKHIDRKVPVSVGKRAGKDRGFNRKLSLIKPTILQSVLANYAWKHNTRIIKVDSYKTSQVEFGTNHIQKHSLGKREFPSVNDPSIMIGRDVNAAKNILDWGLHPDHHIKVKLFTKVKPSIVADFM